ncbi:MAG: (cytosine-5-)-methyltransferase, partial [Candidatus Acidoferrum typicum]|nr:(cytosine-5-)-methyltransferase [Candidatus Acidoferrum typicum]
MKVLDLFSGIGGFSIGLERAGMHTVGFCEIDPYCREVLAKHWPGVPIHGDIRTLSGTKADVICGGFPCQDISIAGDGAGLAGVRSGLWSEYLRVIDETHPDWAVIENVGALRSRGLDQVLRQLSEIGYDAELYCIPAAAVGAPHRRDRVWIVAYPECELVWKQPGRRRGADGAYQAFASVNGTPWLMADADEPRLERWLRAELQECARQRATGESGTSGIAGNWIAEPGIRRVADGVPNRSHRLRSLGNSIVPQIAEIIGRA